MAKPSGKSSKPEMSHDAPASEASPRLPETPSANESTSGTESGGPSDALGRSETSAKVEPMAASSVAKKEVAKPKKPLPTKSSSLLPSQQKLDHLKAAVLAAGNADNLIMILQHVDDAGGRKEVLESIEAYRVLKTVLEES